MLHPQRDTLNTVWYFLLQLQNINVPMIPLSHLSCAWGLYVAAKQFSSIENGDAASIFFIHQSRYNIPFRKAQQIFEGMLVAAASSVSSSYSYIRRRVFRSIDPSSV